MKSSIWDYENLRQWSAEYYKGVMLTEYLTGEEIAIGTENDRAFFYVAKIKRSYYLIPSAIIEEGKIPFRILDTAKIGYKGKAYFIIKHTKDVSIKAEKTMSYKAMIDSWLDYEHAEPDILTLWEMVIDTAFSSRINVRVITYPGWMKDSPLVVLGKLRGGCYTVNKPTIAKTKFLLNESTRILGLNEIQALKTVEKSDLSRFYEDVGDFKPDYVNPSRAAQGCSEISSIANLSTLTFSNFPKDRLEYAKKHEELFEAMFEPKISGRIFPLLLKGGSETVPACKQRFKHVTEKLSKGDMDRITDWLRNFRYYEDYGIELAMNKEFTQTHVIANTRWDKNFTAICERLKLYCDTQEEYGKWTQLLYDCHQDYLDYENSFTDTGGEPVKEEMI